MNITEKGNPSFTHLHVQLEPGEKIITESGAMASCDGAIDVRSSLKGGIFKAIFRKIFGGESLFINEFENRAQNVSQSMVISKPTPGDIVCQELNGDTIYLQPGSFICCTEDVTMKLKWAGFRFLFGGEGLFRLAMTGNGKVWIGVFGALVKHELQGEMIVDTGHLVAYPPEVNYKLQMSGGIISSFTSGEGLVGRLEGHGTIYLQTRSLGGLVGWLNPRLPA